MYTYILYLTTTSTKQNITSRRCRLSRVRFWLRLAIPFYQNSFLWTLNFLINIFWSANSSIRKALCEVHWILRWIFLQGIVFNGYLSIFWDVCTVIWIDVCKETFILLQLNLSFRIGTTHLWKILCIKSLNFFFENQNKKIKIIFSILFKLIYICSLFSRITNNGCRRRHEFRSESNGAWLIDATYNFATKTATEKITVFVCYGIWNNEPNGENCWKFEHLDTNENGRNVPAFTKSSQWMYTRNHFEWD